MPPHEQQEYWAGQVDARLSTVEKQIEAVWVKLSKTGTDVSEIKTDVRELRTLLDSLPQRVQSLEETRAKGRGVAAALGVAAGFAGALVKSWVVKP